MNEPVPTKQKLRERMRELLRNLSSVERHEQSALLRERLKGEPFFSEAKSILFFAPQADEPDIWPLLTDSLAGSKEVFLPRYNATLKAYEAASIVNLDQDLVKGQFGIREPGLHCPTKPLKRLDLILVPGLAFTRDGSRLGRGRGFYDRLLSDIHGCTCGVAFDFQIIDSIPVEQHDIRLNQIMTPSHRQVTQ